MPDGLAVTAPGPDGTPIPFETGGSLAGRQINPSTELPQVPPPTVNSAWNRGAICPYWFDDSQRCLPAGATQMYVLGSGFHFFAGQSLLIETAPATTADPPIRQIVQLLDAGTEECDPLYPPPADVRSRRRCSSCSDSPQGTAVTLDPVGRRGRPDGRSRPDPHDVAGNLVVATQGLTQPAESFSIPQPPAQRIDIPPAIVRTGPNDTPADPSLQYLYTLRFAPMAWLQPSDPTQPPQPEIVLTGQAPDARAGLVGVPRVAPRRRAVRPGLHRRSAQYSRLPAPSGDTLRYDYDGDAGDTLRFGDGVFGAEPEPGATFTALYRSGGGSAGNVAADSITSFDPADPRAAGVLRVTNPMPASGGADPSRWKPSVAWHRRRSGPCSTGPSCRRTTRPPPRPSPGSSGPAPSSDGRGAGSPSSRRPNPLATEQIDRRRARAI